MVYVKGEGVKIMYEFRNVKGHVEVYQDNVFQFSADNDIEARKELEILEEKEVM